MITKFPAGIGKSHNSFYSVLFIDKDAKPTTSRWDPGTDPTM